MRNNRGITLVSLVITIVVLIILSTVIATISIEQFKNMKLEGFYSKLEIAQEGIEKISVTNEKYTDSNGNTVYLRNLGSAPTNEQKEIIESLGFTSLNFRFFNAEQVEKELEITGVNLDLLIDFSNKIVVAPQGVEINGTKYYVLERKKYAVSKNENKNKGNVDFNYSASKYGSDLYKIVITPINVGDITKGVIKYKKQIMDYWTPAENNVIIVNQLTTYDIIYIDVNNNSKQKAIKLSLDNNNNVIATEVTK